MYALPIPVQTKVHFENLQFLAVTYDMASFKTVNFNKQRAITAESMVRYGPLLNLKKTSQYLTM